MSANIHKAREIFIEAVGKVPPEEWDVFLAARCGDDAELHRHVKHLLQAHVEAGSFLEQPVVAPPTGPQAADAGLPPASPAEGPGTWIGPYKLLQKLGEGGMGTVYLAEQAQPVKRQVALKILKAGLASAHVLGRFEQERQALALMDHPNIARVFDAGTIDGRRASVLAGSEATSEDACATRIGRPYFVMELVKGIPITKFCDQEQLTPRQRLELLVPVCQAVQHAHQKGIIHRDLKPSNVLIGLYDGKPVPKVIDFGVAKATGQKLTERTLFTEVGQMVGTLEYMAPEQAELNNLDIDTRADIYALGVLLYELLTGSPPFTGQQLRSAAFAEMLRIIREVEPPKPSTKLSSSEELPSIAAKRKLEPKKLTRLVQGELDWIAMKCLEKERQRRYETANGLAMDLQRYLADEPVLAGPPSTAYRLRKFLRRNKGRVIAALVILVALVGGLIGTSVGMVQAQRSAEAERRAKDEAKRQFQQVEKANEILASVFTDLDPLAEKKDGPDLRVQLGERLEQAARLLEEETVEDALVVAGLQNLLGNSLHALGHLDQAQPLLEKARQTFEDRFGANHRHALACKSNLARLYRAQGKYDRAERLQQEVLQGFTATLGADHAETLMTKTNLAMVYFEEGKYDRAEPLLHELVPAFTANLGADHDGTLATKHHLARLYVLQRKYDRAESLFLEVVQAFTAKLGAEHLRTLESKNNLAGLYLAVGRYDRAEPLFQEVLQAETTKLGANHPNTLACKNNLGLLYLSTGKIDRSIPLLEDVFAEAKVKLGPDHPSTVIAMANLGCAYREAGCLAEAIPMLEEALQRVRKRPVPVPEDLTLALTGLADAYDRAGEFAKAEPLCRELVKQARTAVSLGYLGRSLLRQQRYTEAEPLLRECLQESERKVPDGWGTFNVKSLLGESLLGQRKYAEAEPLLVQGYEGMKQREAKMPAQHKVRLAEAVERLVRLYDAWGKRDEAKKWRATGEAMKAAKDTKRP
jgi:serine/threonine protein kinase/tetratricopeptide (TPR) repeat protein